MLRVTKLQKPERQEGQFGICTERALGLNEMKNTMLLAKNKLISKCLRGINSIIFKEFSSLKDVTFCSSQIEKNAQEFGYLECKIGESVINVPLQNEFGRCYPSYAADVVDKLFDLHKNDIVVDVGGGSNPLKRANIVVDLFPDQTLHRTGKLHLYEHQKFIKADIEDLSEVFTDKSIDFLFTQQTLEHVNDPARACEEIMRVAKRGFIDVPRVTTELHMGSPEHKWYIDLIDNVLIFRKKAVINNGSPSFYWYALNSYWIDHEVALLMDYYYRNVSCVQLLWEDKFLYKVTDW